MKHLGNFIREQRKESGMSLRELARRVSISAPFLSDIELGRRSPSTKNLALISKELGINPEELQQHDHREILSNFKALIENNPDIAIAFRSRLQHMKVSSITLEELAKML
jgi:transcriptional regulator with XRE-family HTH domain